MNPKPFSALNHFTVPCGISCCFLLLLPGAVHLFRYTGPVPTAIPSRSNRNSTRPTTLAGTAIATSILRVLIHEHRSCDRAKSIMFAPTATGSAGSSGEQFTYGGVSGGRKCQIRGRISAAHCSPVRSTAPIPTRSRCATAPTCHAGTHPDEQPLRHVAALPPRHGRPQAWPQWADPDVVRAFVDHGIAAPWSHQLAAANLARDGRHVVLSTGTASGKSLAYQLPILTTLKANPRARALYLSPTKALG